MKKEVQTRDSSQYSINTYLTLFVFIITLTAVLLVFLLWLVADKLGLLGDFRALWVVLSLLLSASLLSTLASSRISKHAIFRTLHSASVAAKKVAEGDFSQRMTMSRQRELAELAECFNFMTEKLSRNEVIAEGFVANVSHEFRNPLSAIRGYAQLLEDETLTPQQRGEYLSVIQEKTVNLSEFVDSVLELTRLDHQTHPTNITTFPLDEQIRQVIVLSSEEWQAKQLDMQVELSPISYRANPELLVLLWRNILDNAIKYSQIGGVITVSSAQTPSHVIVSIADCGIGMDEETTENIFERYYRGKNTTASGHGLGAAIAATIVKQLKGEIIAKSELGVGTTITVTLPKEQDLPS
ncbi:MAG: HAMP domain-containing histidine kinase [Clostridiales bacterium]|nr:HAMP domain-containing histidine kinase [Clostridiales bacterium]